MKWPVVELVGEKYAKRIEDLAVELYTAVCHLSAYK
jgi:hypothetical protein